MKFSIKRRKSYQKYWNSLKGKPSKTKGKTMIEIYGKEKTNKIKKKISNTLKNKYKNGLNSGFKKRNTYGIHIGKDNGMFGKHHTKKTLLIKKKKMKNWWRNKNNKDIIINRNKKISDKLKISKLGSKIKEETKKKMRIAAIKHKIKYGFTKPNIGPTPNPNISNHTTSGIFVLSNIKDPVYPSIIVIAKSTNIVNGSPTSIVIY